MDIYIENNHPIMTNEFFLMPLRNLLDRMIFKVPVSTSRRIAQEKRCLEKYLISRGLCRKVAMIVVADLFAQTVKSCDQSLPDCNEGRPVR